MSTHDFRAEDDPAQRHLFVDPEEIEPEIDRPEGRRYRKAPIRAVGLSKAFVEEVGGPFTIHGTIRIELLVAARAAYLTRRTAASEADVLEYPVRRFRWLEDIDFYAVKKTDTIIKSLQGFAEDLWIRIYKRSLPEGDPLDNDEFERLYDRTRKAIHRSEHLRVEGPAVRHPNKLVRDLHGRYLSISEELERAAHERSAFGPPQFVRCTGPKPSGKRDPWTLVEHEIARRKAFHRDLSKAIVTSQVDGRRRTAEGRRFERSHEREGKNRPQYISVGRWRPSEVTRSDRSDCAVRVPWLVADIDPPMGKGCHWCARQGRVLLRLLRERELDLSHVVVAYSGNSSIHVRIPDGTFGCPLYQDGRAAAETIQRFFDRLCQGKERLRRAIDGNLCYPGHLIRVVGSLHPRTGRRVVGTDGKTFLEKPNEFLFYHAERQFEYSRPERYPLPRRASFCRPLFRLLEPKQDPLNNPSHSDNQDGGTTEVVRQTASPYGNGSAGGADRHLVLDRVRSGVAEGGDWGTDIDPRYVGRNWAALFVAHEQLRQTGEPARAWRAVRDWNRRNEPPLDGDELKSVFEKALRFRERGQS